MMEKVRAKDGHLVLKYQGRLLSSSVDPIREASIWVQNQSSLNHSVSTLIVLGAGSGYHLLELEKCFPECKVICVEKNGEILQMVDEMHGVTLANVTFINNTNPTMVLQNGKLARALLAPYTVLTHEPSVQIDKTYYAEVNDLLFGRQEWAYRKLIEKRDDLKRAMKPVGAAVGENELLSIKTLVSRLADDADAEVKSLLLALKELVV